MTDIPKTVIGTNTTPTITHGVPIIKEFCFPQDYSERLAATLWDTSGKFQFRILEGKVASRAAVNVEGGLAGPNWAGRMEVEGSAADTIRLDVLLDDFKAGMLLGLNFNPQFSLQVQTYTWTEHHRVWPPKLWFTKTWRNLLDFNQDVNLQLISFLIDFGEIIESLGEEVAELIPLVQDLLVFLPNAGQLNLIAGNSGISGYVSDPSSVTDWLWEGLTMSPSLQLEWDLIEIAKAVAETAALIPPVTAAGEAVTLLDKITKWLRPQFATGPVVGIVLEVHLKISGLTGYSSAPQGTITTKNIRSEGAVIVADVASGGDLIPQMDRIGVTFTHRAAISFEFGWHTKVSWLKILSYDVIKTYQASDYGDEIPVTEQYRYELSNTIGNTTNDNNIEISLLETFIFHAS